MSKILGKLPKISAALLKSTSLLLASAARAMEIEKFDKMAAQDQSEYIVVLIEGAQQVLVKEGKKELAAKIHALFTTTLPGDESPWESSNSRTIWRGPALRILDASRRIPARHAWKLNMRWPQRSRRMASPFPILSSRSRAGFARSTRRGARGSCS
jgi:hypothetical protein